MAEDIDNAIRQNAHGPESAGADGVKVKQRPLSDQIAADKYLAGKEPRRNQARVFARWAKAVGLPEKLRTMRQARNEKEVHKDELLFGPSSQIVGQKHGPFSLGAG